jgi:hypothetical protein
LIFFIKIIYLFKCDPKMKYLFEELFGGHVPAHWSIFSWGTGSCTGLFLCTIFPANHVSPTIFNFLIFKQFIRQNQINECRVGFSGDPGSQEVIKTHRKSLLELPQLTFRWGLLSNFPVNKNKFLLIRIVSFKLKKIYTFYTFLS